MQKLIAIFRLLSFLLLIAVYFLPLQLLIMFAVGEGKFNRARRGGESRGPFFGKRGGGFPSARSAKNKLLQSFYRINAHIWGLRIEQHGAPDASRPLLVVSNHSSYLDVPVLGQAAPVRFTPKAEIRHWPLIGWLSVMAGCVFIERRREKTPEARKKLEQVLQQGEIISLFPEGTTNDGMSLLPFHTSFFSLAEQQHAGRLLAVQPVSITYCRKDGTPLTRAEMDKVAWYADMEFVPHLWDFLQTTGVLATLTFHPPVTMTECGGDRKALASYCEAVIRATITPALAIQA